jgi:replicative DNA helicase
MNIFYDRNYELELLRRKLDIGLKFETSRLYFKDIVKAWSLEGTIDLPDELFADVSQIPVQLITQDDESIKRKVTEFYNKRLMFEASTKTIKEIDYTKMHSIFTGVKLASTSEIEAVDNSDLIDKLLDHQLKVADGITQSALKTGTVLDRFDNGFRNEYVLIAARPSVGKSIAGLEIAISVAKTGKKVAYFSFEMSKEALMTRMLFNMSNVSANNPKNKSLSSEQRKCLQIASNDIKELGIYIFDTPCDVNSLRTECLKNNYDVIIIDYLQKIKAHRKADRRIVIEEISSTLQHLPKEVNAPVFCISSLTRPDGKDENKPPNMMELKETSNLEFDADVIILMHRRKEDGVYQKETDIMCTKNRNGQQGFLKADVHGSVYKIKSR